MAGRLESESYKVSGEFWLANDPSRRVHGAVTFDTENGGQLNLIGLLGDDFHAPEGLHRIIGESGHTGCTLERCFETYRTITAGGSPPGTSEWHVGEVFEGIWFGDGEPIKFDMLSANLEHMTSWMNESGITYKYPERGEGWAVTIHGHGLHSKRVPTAFGAVAITHTVGFAGDLPRERIIWQAHGFKVDADKLTSKDDLLEIASDIQDLVSIGIDRMSAFQHLQFHHPAAKRTSDGGAGYRVPITLHSRWQVEIGKYAKPPSPIFGFQDIGGLQGFGDWLNLAAQHRKVLGRIMGARRPKGMYAEDRLMNSVAAAEGLHRELTGVQDRETTLKTRLIELALLAGADFETAIVDHERWSEFLKEERHEIAHNFNRRPSTNVDFYYHMASSLYWLIVLCLLSQIASASSAATKVANSQSFRWMAREVGKIVRSL